MRIQDALGQILSKKRQEIGLSQLALSERAALHLNTVQAIESGRYNPKVSTVYQICHALEVSISEVMLALEKAKPEIPKDKF